MEQEEAIYNIQISDKQDDSGEMGRGTPIQNFDQLADEPM